MARPGRFDGATPIETAISIALERELRAQRAARPPLSAHPIAIAAQDRRRVARLAQVTRQLHEAERRRAHRLALEAALIAQFQGDEA